MTVISRIALHLATAAAVACAMSPPSFALDYPTKPVRLIVGVAAGGANDTVARLVAQALSERLASQSLSRIVRAPAETSALKP
jgi:tripartite-type tricarboxylate transporter receptor subunit TctC